MEIIQNLVNSHIKKELLKVDASCKGCSLATIDKIVKCPKCETIDVFTEGCETCKDDIKKIKCRACKSFLRSKVVIFEVEEYISSIINTLLPPIEITKFNWSKNVPLEHRDIIAKFGIGNGVIDNRITPLLKKIGPNSHFEFINETLFYFLDQLCRFLALIVLELTNVLIPSHVDLFLKNLKIYV